MKLTTFSYLSWRSSENNLSEYLNFVVSIHDLKRSLSCDIAIFKNSISERDSSMSTVFDDSSI